MESTMAEGDCNMCEKDERRPKFGNRFLTDPQNVFEHNAWDNVVWDESQELEARRITQEQAQHTVAHDLQEKHELEANVFWNSFYKQHQNRFFKDRHWLFTEFPELAMSVEPRNSGISNSNDEHRKASEDSTYVETKDISEPENKLPSVSESKILTITDSASDCPSKLSKDALTEDLSVKTTIEESFPGENAQFRILEVGCGVGNTVFPVLQTNNDPGLMVYCCDFSSTAIQLVQEHSDYDSKRCHAFVLDMTSEDSPVPFPENSLDIIILIFVLSAIHPDKMQTSISRLARYLKPGGILLFRDYGRYDMAQLRFKKGRCLSENFYVRGDGTRVYFFTQDYLREMFTTAGLVEEQNLVDRRLQVNRGRQLKMYRVWIQCKYRKPWLPANTDLDLANTDLDLANTDLDLANTDLDRANTDLDRANTDLNIAISAPVAHDLSQDGDENS